MTDEGACVCVTDWLEEGLPKMQRCCDGGD